MAGGRSENGSRDRRHPIIGPSSFAVSSAEWSLRGESQAQPAWSMIYSRGIRRDRRLQRAVCLDLALQPQLRLAAS